LSVFDCSICFEAFGEHRTPKFLPCFHTFCLQCLTELAERNVVEVRKILHFCTSVLHLACILGSCKSNSSVDQEAMCIACFVCAQHALLYDKYKLVPFISTFAIICRLWTQWGIFNNNLLYYFYFVICSGSPLSSAQHVE
jgi:hypothetical protein